MSLSLLPLAIYDDVPTWVLIAIGAGLFLLILLAVVLSVRARRHRRAPAQEPAFAWGDAPPLTDPAVAESASDAAAFPDAAPEPLAMPDVGGPVHYCRCPACQTQFTVNGVKPIVTNCPGCGKKGYLR